MWGRRYALRRATVMRTRILSVTPINPLGVTAPLMNKGSQENGVNAIIGRGYNPSVFSACETSRKASSPSIRSEAPSFIVARAAKPLVFGAKHQTQNVVRQSRTNILPKIHRGAEKCAPSHSVSTGEPRLTRRGRSRAVRRISLREHKEPRLVRIFAPCGYFHENLYKKQPAAFQKNTKRKQRAVRSWVFGENARHDSAKDADFSPTYG